MSQIVDIEVVNNIVEVEVTTLGEQGIQGFSILSGAGVPSALIGFNGDTYIDTTNGDTYIKANDAWTVNGNIKGVQGDNGWQNKTEIEIVNGRALRKLVGYFGGTGTEPTLNVGKYEGVGGWVTDPALATNFINDASTDALALKANSADIKEAIVILPLNISGGFGGTYTNINLANQTVLMTYIDENQVAKLVLKVFNSSGITTISEYTDSSFIGSINGVSSYIRSLVKLTDTDFYQLSANRYNKNGNRNNGAYLRGGDGVITSNANSSYTDYIPVVAGELLKVTGLNYSTASFVGVFYNASYVQITPNGTGVISSTSFTVPSGAYYFRFNDRLSGLANYDNIMLSLQSQATYVPYAVFVNEDNIPPLSTKNTLVGKLWRPIGDSITRADGIAGLIGYVSRIATKTGVSTFMQAENGACVANINNPGISFMMGNLLKASFNINTNLVSWMGGTNDKAYNVPIGTNTDWESNIDTTFKGAIGLGIDWVRTNYPNCKLLWFTPFEQGTITTNTLGFDIYDYRDAIIEMCELLNVPYLDTQNSSLICKPLAYKYFYDGNIHPNNSGYYVVTPGIQEKIIELLTS